MRDGVYNAVIKSASSDADLLQGVRTYSVAVNTPGGTTTVGGVSSWMRLWDDDMLVRKFAAGTTVLVAVTAGKIYGLFAEPPVTVGCPPGGGGGGGGGIGGGIGGGP